MREQLQTAVHAAGLGRLHFASEDDDRATLIDRNGRSHPIYVRWARKPACFVTEAVALRLIHTRLGAAAPATRLFAALPNVAAGVLLVSYAPGANLADFLPPQADLPPLPPTYVHTPPGHTRGMVAAMRAAGRAVRRLHQIQLDAFGLLAGADPNPHRHAARAHTQQEAHYALDLCRTLGWLDATQAQRAADWLAQRLPLLDEGERPCLIHYDLHAGNLRFAHNGDGEWQFSTLLDFELARGLLPEYDLALLSWYLHDAACADWWTAFLSGYAPAAPLHPVRLRLFEMVKALQAMAFSKLEQDWGRWCQARALTLLAES